MKNLNWIQKIFFAINLVIALLLMLSTYGSVIEPDVSDAIYILGLTYPALLLINIVFIFYWLYKWKIHFILSFTVILFGLSNLTHLFATNLNSAANTEADFTVMSFNVRLFNLYQWFDNEDLDDDIFEYIRNQDPDVVAFQEFINYKPDELQYIRRMKKMGYPYYIVEPRGQKNRINDFFGMVTFSKHKIKNWGVAFQYHNSQGKTASLFTDISIKDRIVRVYNTHLNSLRFLTEDYQFVENIANNNEDEAIKKSKNIIAKVMISAKKRQVEVVDISQHIAQSPYPVILVGDFNEPPYSYSYPRLSKNMKDAFLTHGFGLGTTYDGISTLPGLRLDFMLYSESLTSSNFITGPSKLSDHRPITGWFSLPKESTTN